MNKCTLKKISYYFLSLIILLMISSCSMTPKKKDVKFKYKLPEKFNNSDNKNSNSENKKKSIWWKKFEDKELQVILEKVIKNNLDLKIALTNIKNLEAQFKISKVNELPVITSSGGINVSRAPKIGFDKKTGGFTYSPEVNTAYTLQLGARYEIDLFDKYGSLKKASLYNLKATEANYNKIVNMLIAQTIKLYYDIKATKQNILVTKDLIALSLEELELQEKRYLLGVGRVFNIELLKTSTEASKSKLESLYQLLKIKKYMLSTLLGEYPNDKNQISKEKVLPTLEDVNIGVPSDLLKSRPDIVSAEYLMDAAREKIGFSKADRYPSISLTAALGFINILDIENFLKSDFITVSGGTNINQVIFDSGAKSVKLKQAKIAYDKAVLNYKKVVLNAFYEVEIALIKIDSIKKQKVFLVNSLNAVKRSYDDAQKRYVNGIGTYKVINDLRKSIFNTENNIVNLDKALIFAYVELYQAMGI